MRKEVSSRISLTAEQRGSIAGPSLVRVYRVSEDLERFLVLLKPREDDLRHCRDSGFACRVDEGGRKMPGDRRGALNARAGEQCGDGCRSKRRKEPGELTHAKPPAALIFGRQGGSERVHDRLGVVLG